MQAVTTIGLDIAKSVFQVHGIDAQGNVIVRRQLKRRYVLAFFQRHLIEVSPLCQRPRQAPAELRCGGEPPVAKLPAHIPDEQSRPPRSRSVMH
jgi:hypothetical protein